MPSSLTFSYRVLRFSLAAVFIWFGVDKFIHPSYWVSAWVPSSVVAVLEGIRVTPGTFLVGVALFELLVGVSLVSGMFIRSFAGIAAVFLLSILLFFGPTEILVRDIGLMGGLVALAGWPERRNGFL